MKKIMLITPMLHQGGFERICVMTARRLQEKGFDVVIVVFSMEDAVYDVSDLAVIDLKMGARKSRLGKIVNIFRRALKLSVFQRKLGVDISYSFGMTANIANALSCGAKNKITACHSFEEIKNRCYIKLISTHSDRVLCCSKKMADLAAGVCHSANIQPLWNPCDIQEIIRQCREKPGEDIAFFRTEDKVLVSMGREDDVKGYWHLLKIFKKVNEQEPHTRLAIVGEGSFSEYRTLARELGLSEKVCFTGLKANPFPYLLESDIYLLTSLSEGLPNALVEALALSLPIVSANCLSGPAEILHGDFRKAEAQADVFVGDYGILSPPLSPEKDLSVDLDRNGKIRLEEAENAFAQAVTDLLENREQYIKYKQRAAGRAGDFSPDRYMEGLISCMEQL